MTEAPDRIWACMNGPMVGLFVSGGNNGGWPEYVRADLAPTPAQIMADPRVQALVVKTRADALREPAAYYVTDHSYDVWGMLRGQFNKVGCFKRDGWFALGHDYDNADGWCDEPPGLHQRGLHDPDRWTIATHWMPIPPGPQTPAIATE